jgi:hypothetical protein
MSSVSDKSLDTCNSNKQLQIPCFVKLYIYYILSSAVEPRNSQSMLFVNLSLSSQFMLFVNLSLSTRLWVHEDARRSDWRYIMGQVVASAPLTSPEDYFFRISSLMVYTTAAEDEDAADADDYLFFVSSNDTPFDEQVYSE